jgi:two-component sensor histidine kinase
METFVAAIRRLSLARSVEEIMATVTPATRRLLGADGVTFVLRRGEHCHYADEDAISPLWKGRRFPMSACISGWCMKRRQPVAIEDIYSDERIPHDVYRPTFVRSLAMVPVRRDDPVAAMGAYWAEQREVAKEELALLQTMANASALAIASVNRQRDGEEHAAMLRREIDHRVKNAFSLSLALARQTTGANVEEYREALENRLVALQQAHSGIFEDPENAAEICGLLRRLLPTYCGEDRVRIDCTAPDFRLSPAQAADFSLAVNELAVNATKHGAWSTPAGRVRIECAPRAGGIRLTWREEGGPPARRPTRSGFGTRLLRAIAEQRFGGGLRLEYEPDGLICVMEFPIGGRES